MKTNRITASARTETDRKIKELKRQISAAQACADAARAAAQTAKVEFKDVRRIYRRAKKEAKAARKEAKALKNALAEIKPPAVKRRKQLAVQPRTGSLTAKSPGTMAKPAIPVATESVRADKSVLGAIGVASPAASVDPDTAPEIRDDPVGQTTPGVPTSGNSPASGA